MSATIFAHLLGLVAICQPYATHLACAFLHI